MRILIIENEIYLAQSIASKLGELGHICDMSSSSKGINEDVPYDVVLLSTSISGQDFYRVIDAYKNAVVILMVSYISNDTVSKPLNAGAKDYIQKPFMIEELIRKIEHYQEFEKLKRQNETYETYLNHAFNSVDIEHDLDDIEIPLFISCSFQKYADAFAFKYASNQNKTLHFVSLSSNNALQEIQSLPLNTVVYINDFQVLRKNEYDAFLSSIKKREVIISSTEKIDLENHNVIEIKNDNKVFEQGDILPIEDYVKYIVLNYQYKFPDTELSKKLGISRKSLWEKRKKYGIIKKK
jgi:DNA-binding NtrC family response regulator